MHWHIDIWFIHHMPEMKTIQWNLVFEKKAAPSIGIEESENRMKHAYWTLHSHRHNDMHGV